VIGLDDWRFEEEWQTCARDDLYEISNMGGVRNRVTGHILRPFLPGKRRPYPTVEIERCRSRIKVAVLVLETFVGPRPRGMWALHHDDDEWNNAVDNLYWGTPKQNVADAVRNGRRPAAV